AGPHEDVLVRVHRYALQRYAHGDAIALQDDIEFVDRHAHAAALGDDVEQPIAFDAERQALQGAGALAADGDGGTDRLVVGNQHLRLDRLAFERVLDD